MNFKRIKCILTGGCRYKPGTTQVHIDDNDIVTITETCMKCGRVRTFQTEFMRLVSYAEYLHEKEMNHE